MSLQSSNPFSLPPKQRGQKQRKEGHPYEDVEPQRKPMHQYQQFLAELESKGKSSLSKAKPPQQLFDFLVDHVMTLTAVHGGKPERSQVLELLSRIIRKAKPCYSSVVLAMFYLDRLWTKMSQRQSPKPSSFGQDGLPELITSFIIADKYLYDIALANCEWVKVSGVFSLLDINGFEREFLAFLEYNIQFSELAFKEFISFLEVRLLIRQHKMDAVADFPLTFADLVAHNNNLALQHKQQQQQQQQLLPLSPPSYVPQPHTLAALRLFMACCFTCCAVAITVTSAVALLEKSAASAAAVTGDLAIHGQHPCQQPLTATQAQQLHGHPLIKSESWSGFSPSQAMVKAKARKFSDAMLGDQGQMFLTPVGKVRS